MTARSIDEIIKKHLKIGFQTLIERDIITPYDIIRHYDLEIPVYDHAGRDISLLPVEVSSSAPSLLLP